MRNRADSGSEQAERFFWLHLDRNAERVGQAFNYFFRHPVHSLSKALLLHSLRERICRQRRANLLNHSITLEAPLRTVEGVSAEWSGNAGKSVDMDWLGLVWDEPSANYDD
jgi:hypothetical protein